jgi:hypothetical protein
MSVAIKFRVADVDQFALPTKKSAAAEEGFRD